MNKIKLILFSSIILALSILGIVIYFQNKQLDQLKTDIKIYQKNYSALENENSSLKEKNYTFQFTIDQLNHSKDSLLLEMNKVRKALKIKDKELKEMAYLASNVSKTDTIVIDKEIFKTEVHLDTLIKDDWHSLNVSIHSPSTLIVKPEFKSEKYIITYLRKEIINPSRCKIFNLFKRKESILEVEVVENNPYIINTKEKFIKKI